MTESSETIESIEAIEAPPPRRVVLFDSSFPEVDQTFIVNQFLRLIERGWDVHVRTLRKADVGWEFYPGIRNDPELIDRIKVTNDIDQSLARLRPNLVHFEYGNLAIGHLATLRNRGVRSVVSFRGFDIAHWGLATPGVYDEVWRHADVIHCVSEGIWNRCVRRGCPPEKNHAIIRAGIDPTYFDSGLPTFSYGYGAAAHSPAHPFHLLSVGELAWEKGYEYAIHALARLVEQGIDADLTIIGEGSHDYALLSEAFDLGVVDRVRLVGLTTRDALRRHLRGADVFVLPSISEGFGYAALEAQAMQLPVVGSDADGIPELVLDGVTGFIVPRRDADQLARRLAELAGDPALRRAMGSAGRERVREHFTVDQHIDALERLYDETIHRKFAARQLMTESLDRRPVPTPVLAAREALEAELLQRARTVTV